MNSGHYSSQSLLLPSSSRMSTEAPAYVGAPNLVSAEGGHPDLFRFLVTGKYGCTEVRVYPAECGEQLGTDPSKIGSSKSLVLKSFSGEGTLWDSSLPPPSHFGIRLHFYAPTSPPSKVAPICSDFFRFALLFGNAPIYSSLFLLGLLPISYDLFAEQTTNLGNPFLPTPFANPRAWNDDWHSTVVPLWGRGPEHTSVTIHG